MTRARLVVADDHKIFAEGLKRLLEPEFDVVRIVHDGLTLVTCVCELQPDAVVVDISMPGLSGIDATRRLLQRRPHTKVVLLTMHEEAAYATTALDEGVSGYVLKNADPKELLTAIRQSLLGHVFVSPSIAADVFRERKVTSAGAEPHENGLSPTQREILHLLTKGLTAKQIASHLDSSRKSVEYQKYRIMRQLGMETSAELIQYAVKHGIGSA